MFNIDPVNIFFSCDDGYIPFMAVTLASIKANCDPSREYDVRVLHTGISRKNIKTITESFDSDSFRIRFVDISREVERLGDSLYTRDYYSKSTYYRLFIPDLFPELDKALYLDCDIVVKGDISRLYDAYLGTNLVGAVSDGIICGIEGLSEYATDRIGLKEKKYYFNAGVLLMNLSDMRDFGFRGVFLSLLRSVKYNVAQDQDYLNVICKDRVRYLGYEWNVMPSFGMVAEGSEKLIHYNLDNKPWRKDGVQFAEDFWHYAETTPYLADLKAIYAATTSEMQKEADRATANIIAEAHEQALNREENARIAEKVARIVPKANYGIYKRSLRYLSRLAATAQSFLR